MFQNCFKKSA